jgi:hypothetical protein
MPLQNAIFTNITSQIQMLLNTVTEIKRVYPYPVDSPDKNPYAIFFPAGFDNSFETTQENMRVCRYKLFIGAKVTQTTLATIFASVLPNAVDAAMEALNGGWSINAIDGHRAWLKVDSCDWIVSQDKDGMNAVAEFNLDIKLLTNNS